ncbi:MAG: M4 family metallopeptidase [Achromobacter sp.]|uniref:M4 family metallopeptidase n=1 Tax=unclassified Achromobacter TaxID=2626865 RepID=UPI000E74B2C3|nr:MULTISPECIES: M4 family metallopeptidase [unclassified Achromobacter]AYD66388.1 M4 family peptidase [Achromobacter sp. B7]MDX3988191.1 M4 family metallopeptidase [Achromobacter sp.]HCQ45827.1 peptidase M4 family protein [Achromobacter sp.]
MPRPSESTPLIGVIPPYVLDRLAQHTDARVSMPAVKTLIIDQQQRSLRDMATQPPRATLAPNAPPSRPGAPQRAIHDAHNDTTLPGTLVRTEGRPASGDVAVDEAYAHLGATYKLFWDVYKRHSIDGHGLPLVGTVHYGEDYDNAFWNGAQMVFGDGDGEVFNRFTVAVDIIGHELAHGVIDSEAALLYQGQSGALNESLCDVFGALVKQYALGQTARQADWLVGAGLFTEKINARALRSMSEPGSAYDDPALGRDPQPAHMRDYVDTPRDNGGVHINSGIPNRAFFLAATALDGPAWKGAGGVWYDTLCDKRLRHDADFKTFAALTVTVAAERFDAAVQRAVAQAWATVGVLT